MRQFFFNASNCSCSVIANIYRNVHKWLVHQCTYKLHNLQKYFYHLPSVICCKVSPLDKVFGYYGWIKIDLLLLYTGCSIENSSRALWCRSWLNINPYIYTYITYIYVFPQRNACSIAKLISWIQLDPNLVILVLIYCCTI